MYPPNNTNNFVYNFSVQVCKTFYASLFVVTTQQKLMNENMTAKILDRVTEG